MERDTRQRQAILRFLTEANRPLTREEILAGARRYVQGLGAATVDRAIRNLTGEGRLLGVDFPGQPIRYELPGGSEHPHFICRVCNRVFDWDLATPDVTVPVPEGFDVWGHEVLYYGRCPDCRKAENTD